MGAGIIAKILYFCIVCCTLANIAIAQTPEQIIAEINSVNSKVINAANTGGRGMLISDKAVNIFLSNKVSSYLSDQYDLSLYKNYIILNAAQGSLEINHNFHQPVDSDDWVRSFVVIGARANIVNTYAGNFTNRYVSNQLGFVLQKTWMGTPRTVYDEDIQKMAMNGDRALLLQSLSGTIWAKAAAFEKDIGAIKPADVPGQDLQTVKKYLRQKFYTMLREESLQNFSQMQSDLLVSTNNYKWVKDSWTILGLYLPVVPQRFKIIDENNDAVGRYNYPLELFAAHTQFWDSPKYGRFFLTVTGKVSINNSVQSGDTSLITSTSGQYQGTYRNYLTPAISGKIVYIPPDSHVGISFKTEKNFGLYYTLNSTIGIPIVLIDKKGVPAINFEVQVSFSNLNHTPLRDDLLFNKTFVGFTLGLPFSKIVY